jgi:cysteine-rich repeat protein
MASLRRLVLWAVAIGLGCDARALDSGPQTSGGGASSGSAGGVGAVGDGGISVDALADQRPPVDGLGGLGRALCGDGVLDPGEQCDDGNKNSGDGCSPLCQIVCYDVCGTCGATTTCITGGCGDGALGLDEVCDDGNVTGGDGCSADCGAIETGWYCPVPGRRCVPLCGDGIVVGSERCDDGNTNAGDGCSDICLVEPTTARCGDGLIEGAEACDDGTATGDPSYASGCTATCRYARYCGDGVVNGPEECDRGTDANDAPHYGVMVGCTPGCTFPHFCGDAIVDGSEGEQCDLGVDNGATGSPCPADCKLAF